MTTRHSCHTTSKRQQTKMPVIFQHTCGGNSDRSSRGGQTQQQQQQKPQLRSSSRSGQRQSWTERISLKSSTVVLLLVVAAAASSSVSLFLAASFSTLTPSTPEAAEGAHRIATSVGGRDDSILQNGLKDDETSRGVTAQVSDDRERRNVRGGARARSPSLPSPPPVFSEGRAVVSNRTIAYRYPKSFAELGGGRGGGVDGHNDVDVVVVGVLSAPPSVSRRTTVRRTWAARASDDDGAGLAPAADGDGDGNEKSHVFFLVGGEWTAEIASEFAEHGDLIWTDSPEGYRRITYKTGVFLHAVHAHVASYAYVLKTDDDSYVNLERVGRILLSGRDGGRRGGSPTGVAAAAAGRGGRKLDYWGNCIENSGPVRDPDSKYYLSEGEYPPDVDTFPDYAAGVGYALSYEFNACAVSHLSQHPFFPFEDAWTGMLAERCGVPCSNDPRVENRGYVTDDVIFHQIDTDGAMESLDRLQQQHRHPREVDGGDVAPSVSCRGPLCSYVMGISAIDS